MFSLKGISPQIDACSGLIFQKATQTYSQITQEHRRWIDLEDLLQEGLLAALKAQSSYETGKDTKFSTYLYTGLHFHNTGRCKDRLRQAKRASAGLVELDAPVDDEEGGLTPSLASQEQGQEVACGTIQAFLGLCRSLSPGAAAYLIRGLLGGVEVRMGRHQRSESRYQGEIALAVRKHRVRVDELRLLTKSEEIRKMVLHRLAEAGSIQLNPDVLMAEVLECIRCRKLFSLDAVQKGRYVVSTMTCSRCYHVMQRLPLSESCFGKSPAEGGPTETDRTCQLHCRDRAICREFVSGARKDMAKKEKVAEAKAPVEQDELADVDFSAAETKTDKKPKAAKAAPKPATAPKGDGKATPKAAKAPKEPKTPKEEQLLPFKEQSMMRYLFVKAMEPAGLKEKELVTICEKRAYNPKFQLGCLKQGNDAKKPAEPRFTWKITIEGGVIKIYDLKKMKVKKEAAA
jgi:hypothetical protein